MNFDGLISLGDAAAIWHLDDSTLRRAIASKRLKPGTDCAKYGKQWVVKLTSMRRVFGDSRYQEWLAAGFPTPRRKQSQQITGQLSLIDCPIDCHEV